MKLLQTLLFAIKGLFRVDAIRNIGIFAGIVGLLFVVARLVSGFVENIILAHGVRWLWVPTSAALLILRHGEVSKRRKFRNFFELKNFRGYDGKIPSYIKTTHISNYLEDVQFKSKIPLEKWEQIKPDMQKFMEQNFYEIRESEDTKMTDILVKKKVLPKCINWDDSLIKKGRNFAIGEGYEGQVLWDCTQHAHGLVAGATRMGKTSILRCVVHQGIQKNFNIYVFDFKGGGDYSTLEKGYGRIVVSEPCEALDILTSLIVEVNGRMAEFKTAGVSNIDEFNARGRERFIPWLIIIDELAEVLDVNPKTKEEKEFYDDFDQTLRKLARTAAGAGVHILAGIIRPDHKVIDGQIKNNMLFRACGYFVDSAASRIVLDNDKATELPSDIKGRFIVGDKEVQAYYLPVCPRQTENS